MCLFELDKSLRNFYADIQDRKRCEKIQISGRCEALVAQRELRVKKIYNTTALKSIHHCCVAQEKKDLIRTIRRGLQVFSHPHKIRPVYSHSLLKYTYKPTNTRIAERKN